jgi:hypothetical protein
VASDGADRAQGLRFLDQGHSFIELNEQLLPGLSTAGAPRVLTQLHLSLVIIAAIHNVGASHQDAPSQFIAGAKAGA